MQESQREGTTEAQVGVIGSYESKRKACGSCKRQRNGFSSRASTISTGLPLHIILIFKFNIILVIEV